MDEENGLKNSISTLTIIILLKNYVVILKKSYLEREIP
jgi:hypothetical protein